jgi:RNase P/RNase MRP subunit p29
MCVATATMFEIVRRSKNAALVGASGIVVQETENTFKVVTRKNKSKGACVVA